MQRKIIAVVITSALLSACGGGSSSSSTNNGEQVAKNNLKGLAIDGYISGANVFLDLNFNGIADANEPTAVTDSNGQYDLGLTGSQADCKDYAPVIIDVPVGAIDSDAPNTPIEEAYRLSYPPAFAAKTDEEIKATTPLTTLIWGDIQSELASNKTQYTCEGLKSNLEMREKIIERVKQQEQRVAHRYNVTADELYGDFIAKEKPELHEFARKIVPSLQKSYRETKTLQEANPNAIYAYVEYFWGLWDETGNPPADKWYRTKYVNMGDSYETDTYEVSKDLSSDIRLIEYAVRQGKETSAIIYERVTSAHYNETGDNYGCNINEFYEQKAKVSYGVENQSHTAETDWKNCLTMDPTLKLVSQSAITKTYDDNGTDLLTDSRHKFEKGDNSGLEALIGLGDNIESLDGSEFDVMKHISPDFEDTNSYGASSWWRVKNEFFEGATGSNPTQIMTRHNSSGKWSRLVNNADGTHYNECSDDGSAWTAAQQNSSCEK